MHSTQSFSVIFHIPNCDRTNNKKKNSIHFSTYNIYDFYVNHNSCKLNELFTKKRINFTLFAELGFFEKGENAPPAPNDN